MWASCAAALDGCIYFMPCNAYHIMKLDPNNNDAMTSVGDDLGDGWGKYCGTVVGIDGCVYGIPSKSKCILKYDPINDITSFVGEGADEDFRCNGNGAMGRDGYIYVVASYNRVLKIDATDNSYDFVRNYSSTDPDYFVYDFNWQDAILGIDGCIYWPPHSAGRTLKYDPRTDQISLVGCEFGMEEYKWSSGALTTDGVIFCIPTNANQVLAIGDPWGDFVETTKANMEAHPETFGSLFQIIEVEGGYAISQTNFDHAVIKFGQKQVCEALETCMKPVNDYCKETNLCPFMIVASYKETSTLSAINHLPRRDLSWVNNCTNR